MLRRIAARRASSLFPASKGRPSPRHRRAASCSNANEVAVKKRIHIPRFIPNHPPLDNSAMSKLLRCEKHSCLAATWKNLPKYEQDKFAPGIDGDYFDLGRILMRSISAKNGYLVINFLLSEILTAESYKKFLDGIGIHIFAYALHFGHPEIAELIYDKADTYHQEQMFDLNNLSLGLDCADKIVFEYLFIRRPDKRLGILKHEDYKAFREAYSFGAVDCMIYLWKAAGELGKSKFWQKQKCNVLQYCMIEACIKDKEANLNSDLENDRYKAVDFLLKHTNDAQKAMLLERRNIGPVFKV